MDVNKSINIRLVQAVEKYPCLYNNNLKEYSQKECTERAWIEIAMDLKSTPNVVKERWKSFRSVFVRRLKQLHMGELIKPYYLHEHMQYIVPYLQSPWDPESRAKRFLEESENRLSKGNRTLKDNGLDNEDALNYVDEIDYSHISDQENDDLIYHDDNAIQHTRSSNKRKRKKSTDSEEDNYHVLNEYKTSKSQFQRNLRDTASKLSKNCVATHNDNPKRQFLLSLLPDIEQMNNAQMRLFKIKTIALVNDIFENTI